MCLVVCSLCDTIEFDNEDPDFDKRIDRHINFHKQHSVNIRTKNGQVFTKNINVKQGTPTFTEKN